MFIKAPKFWYKDKVGSLEMVLYPLSLIYGFFASLNYKAGYKSKIPETKIIAVGGLTAGGAGKTPTVIALCEFFKSIEQKAVVLTRGFGRKSSEILMVNTKNHLFQHVGDEALLMAESTDVFVGADRLESARKAKTRGNNVMILDDGLTQRYIEPDIKLVVIDNHQAFGNGHFLPLGPNRLNFDVIKTKNDIDAAIVIKSSPDENPKRIARQIPSSIPMLTAYIEQDFSQVEPGERILAFAGLGYPKKFFQLLDKKMNVVKSIAFPDHHPFSDHNMTDLLDEANILKAKLLTTEKDLVRIPKQYHDLVRTIPMKIIFDDTEKLHSILFKQENENTDSV